VWMLASGRIHGHLAAECTRSTCHRKARVVQLTAASYTPSGQKKTSYKDISGTADSQSSNETICLSVQRSCPRAWFRAHHEVAFWFSVLAGGEWSAWCSGRFDSGGTSTLGTGYEAGWFQQLVWILLPYGCRELNSDFSAGQTVA